MIARKSAKMGVTLRAVTQRINRRLRHDGRMLRMRRGNPQTIDFRKGPWYLVDVDRNWIVREHLNLADVEDLARELRVLEEWEEVIADE